MSARLAGLLLPRIRRGQEMTRQVATSANGPPPGRWPAPDNPEEPPR